MEPDVPLVPDVVDVYSVPFTLNDPVKLIEPERIKLLFSSSNICLFPFLLNTKPSTSVVAPLAAPIVQFSLLQLKRIPEATLSGVLKLALL